MNPLCLVVSIALLVLVSGQDPPKPSEAPQLDKACDNEQAKKSGEQTVKTMCGMRNPQGPSGVTAPSALGNVLPSGDAMKANPQFQEYQKCLAEPMMQSECFKGMNRDDAGKFMDELCAESGKEGGSPAICCYGAQMSKGSSNTNSQPDFKKCAMPQGGAGGEGGSRR